MIAYIYNSDYILLMKHEHHKQQPFHVKRKKMKDSIISCQQIIQQFSQISSRLKKSNYQMKDIIEEEQQVERKIKVTSYRNGIAENDVLNSRFGNASIFHMRDLIRMYQLKRSKEMTYQMASNGLDVKKMKNKERERVKTEYEGHRVSQERNKIKTVEKQNAAKIFTRQSLRKMQEVSQHELPEKKLMISSVSPSFTVGNELPAIDSHSTFNKKTAITDSTLNSPLAIRINKRIQTDSSAKVHQKKYLYQKMALLSNENRQHFNPIYERRIKSYLQFLWRVMIGHNIYSNLDFNQNAGGKQKYKAFIGCGNNSNMVKGLVKRRFWWSVTEENGEDCVLVWSQLRSNKIFRRQASAHFNTTKRVYSQEQTIKYMKKQRKKQTIQFAPHRKIWNELDCSLLRDYIVDNHLCDKSTDFDVKPSKQQSFISRTAFVMSQLKEITIVEDSVLSREEEDSEDQSEYQKIKPIVHNHLQNNFHLGNKKALFHNLRYYYSKTKENPFDYIPLTFHIKNGFKDPEYRRFVKYYQERKEIIRTEEEESGYPRTRNIWIVKPGENTNRGRGIVVIDQIYQLDNMFKKHTSKFHRESSTESKTFIVQKYIDRPFLYYDRKFDIRHYMLITNLFGVTRAYWYSEGYVRTSSYLFDIHNFQPEIHLTNDAVQQKYDSYGRYQPFNKLSYAQFQSYLNTFVGKKCNFRRDILPQMKKMAADAAKSVYTRMNPHNQMHNFQVLGLDFMLDKNYKPWLIEVNTNPCLDCSSPVLNRIVPYMIEDALKLTIDVIYPPPSHYPNNNKHNAPYINLDTFKYELIFDSLAEGEELLKTMGSSLYNMGKQIGQIEEDQEFKDNGAEIKLQDYT